MARDSPEEERGSRQKHSDFLNGPGNRRFLRLWLRGDLKKIPRLLGYGSPVIQADAGFHVGARFCYVCC